MMLTLLPGYVLAVGWPNGWNSAALEAIEEHEAGAVLLSTAPAFITLCFLPNQRPSCNTTDADGEALRLLIQLWF